MKIETRETITIKLTRKEAQLLALYGEFSEGLTSYEKADEKTTLQANDFVRSLAYSLDRKLCK